MRRKALKNLASFMLAITMVLTLVLSNFTLPVSAASGGFQVNGTKLYDANGNEFIIRGVNYPHAWYTGEYATAIPAIAAKGFNTVRIVLANGQQWNKTTYNEVSTLIDLCKANNLVAVLEVHDATGSDSTYDLNQAVNYWIEMKNLLIGNEAYVIVNIANEWYGSWENMTTWKNGYISAIRSLRDAGINNTIMIDSAGWGQYPQSIFDYGKEILNADTKGNTMFSIHMYEYAGGSDSVVKTNIDNVINQNLCLVIGEFGGYHTGGDVAEQTIMDYCQQKNVGWMAWSWTGNGSDLSYLDLCYDFAGSNLTEFGNTVINGTNGIKQTAKTCSVFTGSTGGNASSGNTSSGNTGSGSTSGNTNTNSNGGVNGLDGEYYIKNVYSGLYLDVNGGNSANGTNIQQWQYNGGNAQKFKLVSDGNGYYSILTACSGYNSGIDVNGKKTADGTNIIQWAYNGGDNQKFQIVKIGDAYAIKTKISNCYSGLDVYNWSTSNGGNVCQWNYWGGDCQLWYLEPVSGSSSGSSSSGSGTTNNGSSNSSGNTSSTTGTTTNIFYGKATASNWSQAVSVSTNKSGGWVDITDMNTGDYVWVEYSGSYGELELVFQSWSGGENWAKISPSELGSTNNGTYYAKFYYDDIVSVYGNNFSTVNVIHVGAYSGSITVLSVDLVK